MFVFTQQRSLQNNTFLLLIPNRNIQASWKKKFLRTRKVSSSSLKFKFPCMNFFQLSHFKVDSKICRTPHENWGRRWHHCCDNFEWNWYIDRSSILWSRTFIRGWLQRLTPMSKTKHLRQMLICRLDRAVNDRIQMWWLAKFFWIFKFKYTTKTLHYDLFYTESASDFKTYPYEISTKIYFVVQLFKKVWTWGGEILNALFCKNDLFPWCWMLS